MLTTYIYHGMAQAESSVKCNKNYVYIDNKME